MDQILFILNVEILDLVFVVSQKTNLSKKDFSLRMGVSGISDSSDIFEFSVTLGSGLNTPEIYSAGLLEQLVNTITEKNEYSKILGFILLCSIYSQSA